jgi:hypothetical protein
MSRDKFRPLIKAIADLPSDGHELGQILDLVKHLKFQIGADEKLQLLLRDLNKRGVRYVARQIPSVN